MENASAETPKEKPERKMKKEKQDKSKEKPTTSTPQRKPSNQKTKESSQKNATGERLHKHHSGHQQQTAPTTPATAGRFALSSYQTAPDAADVPRPSLRMLANAKQSRCSWLPTSLPDVPTPEQTFTPTGSAFNQVSEQQQDAVTQEMTVNLMKMLGITQGDQ